MYVKNPLVLLALSKEKTLEKNGQFLALFYLQFIFLAPVFLLPPFFIPIFKVIQFHKYWWYCHKAVFVFSFGLFTLLYKKILAFFKTTLLLISLDPTVTLSASLQSHIVNACCQGREEERESGQGTRYVSVSRSLFLWLEWLYLNQWNWNARKLLEKELNITNTVEDHPGTLSFN